MSKGKEKTKREPNEFKYQTKTAECNEKGTKRDPEGSQKGAKSSQKEAKQELKSDQNASTNRPSEKVAKMEPKGFAARQFPGPFLETFPVKNR